MKVIIFMAIHPILI